MISKTVGKMDGKNFEETNPATGTHHYVQPTGHNISHKAKEVEKCSL